MGLYTVDAHFSIWTWGYKANGGIIRPGGVLQLMWYLSLELTFYGIAENTVAAAISFEMAYNLIAEWARPYKGVGSKNGYSLGVPTS